MEEVNDVLIIWKKKKRNIRVYLMLYRKLLDANSISIILFTCKIWKLRHLIWYIFRNLIIANLLRLAIKNHKSHFNGEHSCREWKSSYVCICSWSIIRCFVYRIQRDSLAQNSIMATAGARRLLIKSLLSQFFVIRNRGRRRRLRPCAQRIRNRRQF